MPRPAYPLKRLLNRHLLRIDEALNGYGYSKVDVVGAHIFSQRHFRAGLGHADHALQVTDSDRERSCRQGLAPQVCEETRELLLV